MIVDIVSAEGVKLMEHTKTYRKYKENSKDRFLRYSEGAEMYHISVSKFMQMERHSNKQKSNGRYQKTLLANLKMIKNWAKNDK